MKLSLDELNPNELFRSVTDKHLYRLVGDILEWYDKWSLRWLKVEELELYKGKVFYKYRGDHAKRKGSHRAE